MPRYRLTLAYDGSPYLGWQIQAQGPTVQSVLHQVLQRFDPASSIPISSGRTDAGVHALAQVVHCDIQWAHGVEVLHKALNATLPATIRVHAVSEAAPDFHARRDAREKWYRYQLVAPSPLPWALSSNYAWVYDLHILNLTAMQAAAAELIGEHDFKSFQSVGTEVLTTVRRLTQLSITPAAFLPWPLQGVNAAAAPLQTLCFDLKGNGFLKQMVRNIVGTLIEVGLNERTPESMRDLLLACDRKQAGYCAPAGGLYLMEVAY